MDSLILQSMSPEERLETLKSTAFAVEAMNYPRELSQGELQELQQSLSQDLIFIDQKDQELKIAKEVYSSAVKPIREGMKEKLQKIRTHVEDVHEEVFLLKDAEAEKMGYYNREGKLVFERALLPNERQYTIQEHLRKAE